MTLFLIIWSFFEFIGEHAHVVLVGVFFTPVSNACSMDFEDFIVTFTLNINVLKG